MPRRAPAIVGLISSPALAPPYKWTREKTPKLCFAESLVVGRVLRHAPRRHRVLSTLRHLLLLLEVRLVGHVVGRWHAIARWHRSVSGHAA